MKPLVCCAMFVIALSFTAAAIHSRVARAAAPDRLATVSVTRIFTGPDGLTHAEPIEVSLSPGSIPKLQQSAPENVASAYFVSVEPGFVEDWHNASAHRYVFTLSGRAEIELAGGEKIPLDHDRVLLADDLTGKGHITRVIGKEAWIAAFVQIEK